MAPPSVRCSESAELTFRRSFFRVNLDSLTTFAEDRRLSSPTPLALGLRYQVHYKHILPENPLVRGTEYWNEKTIHMVLGTSEQML